LSKLSKIGDDVMTCSVASMYLKQGRKSSSKASIDTIYTPEGTFIGIFYTFNFSDTTVQDVKHFMFKGY
uniref:DDE_Tnp_1_7 domain-containing protein n=1 Tax=Gongylonema pulchrum TaxID=637853 RepID=A0A183DM36_9BILA